MRREEHDVGARAMEMKVYGRRPRTRRLGRLRLCDAIKEKGLSVEEVHDRATWRRMVSYIDPT